MDLLARDLEGPDEKKIVVFDESLSIPEIWKLYYEECKKSKELVCEPRQRDGDVEALIPVNAREVVRLLKAKFITDSKTGRQKFFISEPAPDYEGTLANQFMIVTATGNNPEKEPAGHVWVDGSRRWENNELGMKIASRSKDVLRGEFVLRTDETYSQGECEKRQTFRKSTVSLTEGGILVVNQILEGPGHERIWSIYYPPDALQLELVTNLSHHYYHLSLGFGMTVVQGDTSDKYRSESGATHVVLEKDGIKPNFIEYF